MFRTPFRNCYRTIRVQNKCQNLHRNQSSSSSGGGSGLKTGAIIVGTGVVAVAGAVGYASYDQKFRTQLEENIPYANDVLKAIIGPQELQKKTPVLEKKVDDRSLLTKKLEREKIKESGPRAPTPVVKKEDSKASLPPKVAIPILSPPIDPPTLVSKSAEKSESSSKSEDVSSAATTSGGLNPNSHLSPVEVPKDSEAEKSETKVKKSVLSQELSFEARQELQEEMRQQLKIQLSAYSDYLKEQLRLQENELNRLHSVLLEEKVLEEKMRYQQELASSIVRLQEMEKILQVREKIDADEHSQRELWLLCQKLNEGLKSDPFIGIQKEPSQVLKEIRSLVERLSENEEVNSLSRLALKSIPKSALETGIYTEDALRARFEKVDRVCRRVSLIGDEGSASLWRYFLSWIQSSLVVDAARITPEELNDSEVNVGSWDTFDILARVRHYLNERNLEMSLRYANQLKGEPRKAASDWIRDVRNHLEVRQAASILQAQSASLTLRCMNRPQ